MAAVIIIGAGISGLAVAYRLQQLAPDLRVTILEQSQRPGGKIWTECIQGFQIEAGPNGFLDTKPSTTSLCRDVGLWEALIPASEAAAKNRFLFLDGGLRRLPGGLGDFVRSDLLSWQGKIGLLLERFRRRGASDGDESIEAFARRRAGRKVADVLADALVTGIYAGDARLLSMRACFPRLVELERQYGSVMKGLARVARQRRAEAAARGEPYQRPGRMWSFRQGLRVLIETLREQLKQPPIYGVNVRAVQPAAGSDWLVRGEGQDTWTSDAVVLACPAYQQAAMLSDLDAELARLMEQIAYNRVAVVALGYRRDDVPTNLEGFGYITPQRTRRDVLGVQWCSSIFPERAPPGMCLLRAMCGGWHRAEVAGWDDERLVPAVRDDLRQALGIQAAPVLHHVIRWDRAIPQYHVGHTTRVARIEERAARHAGLFLGGNAYHGVALNDCTEQGERLAAAVCDYLRLPKRVKPQGNDHP
jgi:protoporphyrinogen/coproporphyrinogen III oxidase